MNILELQRDQSDAGPDLLRIVIDGRSLIDRVSDAEAPIAARSGQPGIAGSYMGLDLPRMPDIRAHLLGYHDELYDHDGLTEILMCKSCGEPGCWPFAVRIIADQATVRWGEYRQPHRPSWRYERLPEFTFDRGQYEGAIARLASQLSRPSPVTGLRRDAVRLAEHDSAWAALFATEADVIRRQAGDLAIDVQHIGSTAVPGLVAKPILDIAVAVTTPDAPSLIADRLRIAGYLDRGSAGGNGGHLLVKEAAPDVRTVHVHVVDVTDPQWKDYLHFRDLLRTDEAIRDAYHELKTELAERYGNDRRAYTEGKEAFIRHILNDGH